jgi:hypothetical protein
MASQARLFYSRPMFIAFAAAFTALASPTAANDICLAMLPPRLSATLERGQPDYALPLLTDASPDRLLANAQAGGWPCPFAAVADFDGDGDLDRAVLLRHKNEIGVRLVIARNEGGEWRIELQKDWPIALTSATLEPLEAGRHEQTKAGVDVAAQLDTLNVIEADHPGFLAGQTEGAKAAFFFQNGAWREMWVAE